MILLVTFFLIDTGSSYSLFNAGFPKLSVYEYRRRRRLKSIHSRSDTNRTGARGFILLLPQTAALPGSDAGSDVIKPASSFVIQNR